MHRRPLLRTALALPALALPGIARAQARRPLRIIVPFPPGGAVDSLARVMADRLPALLDQQQVVVDNRSGGGGLIGADAVAKAPHDGTTIGIIGAATLCAAPFLQQSMPFDVARDLRAVTQITDSAVLLAVSTQMAESRGWTNMAALLDWARANPGAFRVAHSGVATVTHLVMSAVVAQSRVDMTLVPYRGGAQQATTCSPARSRARPTCLPRSSRTRRPAGSDCSAPPPARGSHCCPTCPPSPRHPHSPASTCGRGTRSWSPPARRRRRSRACTPRSGRSAPAPPSARLCARSATTR